MDGVIREHTLPQGQRLQIVHGDITQEKVDAIVNAANAHLKHGGGVAGAIVRRGGAVIQAESDEWVRRHGPVSHESPAFTSAGLLPCRYIIHAVGPIWGEGNEVSKLAAAVKGSLQLANQLKLSSLSMPAISTGIFGFPKERAARVILKAILDYFAKNPTSTLNLVRLTLFDQPTIEAFLQAWDALGLGGIKEQPEA
jgi:O-acetyl-ADP-ribose deacetylase (regulator of RNase III)